jgi:hypothetical protein
MSDDCGGGKVTTDESKPDPEPDAEVVEEVRSRRKEDARLWDTNDSRSDSSTNPTSEEDDRRGVVDCGKIKALPCSTKVKGSRDCGIGEDGSTVVGEAAKCILESSTVAARIES